MKKTKLLFKIAVIFLAIWILIALIDFGAAISGYSPIFCIKSDSYYQGFGYSYVISAHPITGKSEYCLYIFGCPVMSDFTN